MQDQKTYTKHQENSTKQKKIHLLVTKQLIQG